MSNIFNQSKFFVYNNELGIYDYLANDFISKIKELPVLSVVNTNNRILDEIAHDELNNIDVWWILGIYNDIVDPINIKRTTINIPDISHITTLLLKYIESNT